MAIEKLAVVVAPPSLYRENQVIITDRICNFVLPNKYFIALCRLKGSLSSLVFHNEHATMSNFWQYEMKSTDTLFLLIHNHVSCMID